MSKSFWVVADVACDLPASYVEAHEKLIIMPMPYQSSEQEFIYKTGDEVNMPAFYESLKGGAVYTTTQLNIDAYCDVFKSIVEKGEGLICIPLSSGISGSYNNAMVAMEKTKKKYPEAKIAVCDSKSATLGYGLLIHHLLEERKKGIDIETAENLVNTMVPHLIHYFTVNDLKCLYRGGRLSKSSAYLGSMLRIKPVLHVNEEGRLQLLEKVQGRKRSIKTLAQKVESSINPKSGQAIFISHADCEEDALLLKSYLQETLPDIKDYLIAQLSAIIGSHSGPGTLAVFFLGDKR
ncbi:MAG: DegV family protein [Eubacteriales bacterium]|nr:DegV family protein [Eubacteriales bacterium]